MIEIEGPGKAGAFTLGPDRSNNMLDWDLRREKVMKKASLVLLVFLLTGVLYGQQPQQKAAPKDAPQAVPKVPTPEAKPEDVKSVDAIVKTLYEVISGPAGTRDWNRFNSLFIPEARMAAAGKRPDGTYFYRSFSPAEYQERSGAYFLKEGFFETGIHNLVEQFGQEAHVWSTYESRHEKGGQPFARGINSIQLLNDGKRWWVVSILWDSERPDNPIPEKYLSR
jgi:hypothetical protein